MSNYDLKDGDRVRHKYVNCLGVVMKSSPGSDSTSKVVWDGNVSWSECYNANLIKLDEPKATDVQSLPDLEELDFVTQVPCRLLDIPFLGGGFPIGKGERVRLYKEQDQWLINTVYYDKAGYPISNESLVRSVHNLLTKLRDSQKPEKTDLAKPKYTPDPYVICRSADHLPLAKSKLASYKLRQAIAELTIGVTGAELKGSSPVKQFINCKEYAQEMRAQMKVLDKLLTRLEEQTK